MRIYLFSTDNFKSSENLIHIGDICLLYELSALYIWIENNDSKKERLQNQMKSTLVCAKIQICCPSNPMIFSYDGVSKRNGNHEILRFLTTTLENNAFNDLIKNALNILEYKEDRIDIIPITQLFEQAKIQHHLSQPTINKDVENSTKTEIREGRTDDYSAKDALETKSNKNKCKVIYPPQAYYFFDYLEDEAKDYWTAHYLYENSTHVIYNNIRNFNKKKYSEAFDKFRRNHSDLNIYSIKENFDPITIIPDQFEKIDYVQALYDLLSSYNYSQICNNKWKTPDGHFINITIEKCEDNNIQETKKEPIERISKNELEAYESTTISDLSNIISEDKINETFKHVSSTYKFFWFWAILTISNKKNSHRIYYKELVAKMISLAYPYTEERISFGTTDKFHDIIQSLILTDIFKPMDMSVKNEERIISNYDIKKIHAILNHLLLNVPYRFLSTWISFTNNKAVITKSQDPRNCTPYAIYTDYIVLNADWHHYFKENNERLIELTQTKLTEYLRRFNDKMLLNRCK